MNKIKVSMKDMRDNYYVIGIPYCNAQFLLSYEAPIAYSSGVYGWNCDYYNINTDTPYNSHNVVISTGYRYIDNKRTAYDYDLLTEYNNKARQIGSNYDIDFQDRKRQIKFLLDEFINLAIHNYENTYID